MSRSARSGAGTARSTPRRYKPRTRWSGSSPRCGVRSICWRTAPWAPGVAIATVFLGGGTPSLLDGRGHGGAARALRAPLRRSRPEPRSPSSAIPRACRASSSRATARAGVNRISLGVQSLDDASCRGWIACTTRGRARRAFEAAREAGFDNVSADLIYGLPGLDAAAVERRSRACSPGSPSTSRPTASPSTRAASGHAAGVERPAAEDGGRAVLGAGPRGGARAGSSTTRSPTTRGRASLAPQPDLLARGGVPGGRARAPAGSWAMCGTAT